MRAGNAVHPSPLSAVRAVLFTRPCYYLPTVIGPSYARFTSDGNSQKPILSSLHNAHTPLLVANGLSEKRVCSLLSTETESTPKRGNALENFFFFIPSASA
jgi:hypothetical protein